MRIEQLSGQVLDVSGGIIPDATILLLDSSTETLIDRLTSDRLGKFSSTYPLAGTYTLVVGSPGFTPFRGTVHAAPRGNSSGNAPLKLQLGVGGTCSTANQPSLASAQ